MPEYGYLVQNRRWYGFTYEVFVNGLFKTEEAAWQCIENLYYNFINDTANYEKIQRVHIFENTVEIRFYDTDWDSDLLIFYITKLEIQ